ncbi:unnamed protein product [Amoebophrya sp. A120]|nr:unnamed protein product [Amoebophrya sp. A120]|eukprot:GSA120T00006284001.1
MPNPPQPPKKQKVLLTAEEPRSSGFQAIFKAPSQLGNSYQTHVAEVEGGKKTGNLQISKLDAAKYMDAYAAAERPPKEEIQRKQELIGDLARMQRHVVEQDPEKDIVDRSEKREKFLQSRKKRHDDAVLDCEAEIDKLHDSCTEKLQNFSKNMKTYIKSRDVEAEAILEPLENDLDKLGEQSEAWVQNKLTELEEGIAQRETKITEFHENLQELEKFRKREALDQLTSMVNKCTAAAHCSPGEVERICDAKSHTINSLTLENCKKATEVFTRLKAQNNENSKVFRRRWYEGLLRWKRKRHQTAVENVLQRIESREFRACPELVSLLARIRAQQRDVFEQRKELLVQVFTTEIDSLNSNKLRGIEEQITAINDRTSEETDNFLVELKELKDTLQYKSEGMLNQLRTELEMYDARTEWGDYESVKALVDGDIKPHMRNCLNWIENLCLELANVMQTLDEWAHHTCFNLNTFSIKIATLLEQFKQQLLELKVKHQGEIDDCIQDHEDEKKRNEQDMVNFHELMDDEVHIEGLDVLLQQTFDKLDVIAQSYRDFAKNLLDIHRSYEPKIHAFFRLQTDLFIPHMALTRKPEEDELEEEEDEEGGSRPQSPKQSGGEEEETEPFWGDAPENFSFALLKKVEDDLWRLQLVPKIDEEGEEKHSSSDDPEEKTVGLPADVKKELALDDSLNRVVRMPKCAEGTWTLEELIFKTHFVEDLLRSMRKRLFAFLHEHKSTLDDTARAVLKAEDERINMELDQTLRRHTNRKGEVQVDWYNPRYTIIEKHKNRFERHMITIAQKSAAQEDEAVICYEKVVEAETVYHETIAMFTGKLSEARNLAALTAVERKGKDCCAKFVDVCRSKVETLETLAINGIQSLVLLNRDFVRMCKAGGDNYSKSEIIYYKEQTTILNDALSTKKADRTSRLDEEKAALPQRQQDPLEKFLQAYADAVDKLSQELGLGPVYGAPRRRAQEACRTIMSRTDTTLFGLGQYFRYFKDVMDKKEEPGPHTLNFQLRQQEVWKKKLPPPSTEMKACFLVIVTGMLKLGKHLEAFKSKFNDKYNNQDDKAVTEFSKLEERILNAAGGGAAAPDLAEDEKQLMVEVSEKLLGAIPTSDLFTPGIAKVDQAGKDAYKSGLPDFMAKFLADMKVSTESHRQKNCRELREKCRLLRDEVLLQVGPSAFGDLLERQLESCKQAIIKLSKQMGKAAALLEERRLSHEQRLTPSLANPNNARILQKLKDDEALRYKDACESLNRFKLEFANTLQREAVAFLHKLVLLFQTLVRVLDAVPMPTHFNPLPGDENVQKERMSIKRRKRRVFAGHEGPIEVDDEKLPPRTWEGVATNLWQLDYGEFFAVENEFLQARISDPAGAPASLTYTDAEKQIEIAVPSFSAAATTPVEEGSVLQPEPQPFPADSLLQHGISPSIESFRTDVHKSLFRKRNSVYEEFKVYFQKEVRDVGTVLKEKLEKEHAGEANWQNMCQQLVSGLSED